MTFEKLLEHFQFTPLDQKFLSTQFMPLVMLHNKQNKPFFKTFIYIFKNFYLNVKYNYNFVQIQFVCNFP